MLNHYVVGTRPSEGTLVAATSNVFQFLGNGVQLFFVLSGFLITGILLQARGSDSYFRTFYARRTLRIFPLYYGVLLVVFGTLLLIQLCGGSLHPDAIHSASHQGYLWLYLTNFWLGLSYGDLDFGMLRFGHFWSLAVEEQFYLIWPLLVLLLGRRTLMSLCIAACVGLPIARAYFQARGNNNVVFYLLSNDGLFMGSWLALATNVRSASPRLARRSLLVSLFAGAGFLGLLLATFAARANVLPPSVAKLAHELQPLMNTMQCLMFSGLMMLVITVSQNSFLRRLAESRPATYLGKISYGIYVYHILLMNVFVLIAKSVVGMVTDNPFVIWVGCVLFSAALAVAAAAISWSLFERPVLRLKERFAYSFSDAAPAPVALAAVANRGTPVGRAQAEIAKTSPDL